MDKNNVIKKDVLHGATAPLFSVIINVYNSGSLIVDCLQSVFMQDIAEDEYEVVIIDDSSMDGSIDYINEQTEGHTNVTLLRHTETRGRGGALNTAMRQARGQYLVFLDSNDYWQYANTLSSLKNIISGTRADIIDSTTSKDVPYKSHPAQTSYNNEVTPTAVDGITLVDMPDFSLNAWSAAYRREMIVESGIWFAEHVMYENIDWRMRVIYQAESVVRISVPFYCHRLELPADEHHSIRVLYDSISCYKRLHSFASGSISQDMRDYVAGWILRSVTAYPTLARRHRPADSKKALSRLRATGLLSLSTYRDMSAGMSVSLARRLRLFFLHSMPSLLLLPAHLIWKVRKSIR
ncbi:MAG: glycosyltransferase family 2 protein [Prevotella sp.]